MQPLVTCIIPVFNHEQWCNEAVFSMVRQDYPNKHLIIVDDGSTDNSFGEVKSLLKEERLISEGEPIILGGKIEETPTLICKFSENHGPSFSRNFAIKTGWENTKYFAFLDSDDIYEQGKISESVKILEENNMVGVVYSDFVTFNKTHSFRQFKEPYSWQRLLQECIINNDSVVSKEALEFGGLYDESMRTCEDYSLWILMCRHYLAHHIPKPLVRIRIGEHSASTKVPKEVWEACYKRCFEKLNEKR